MKNYIQEGKAIDVASTPSGGYTAGLFYVYGIMGGVAALTSLETEANTLNTEGVYSLAKTTSQVWALGELLYWDAGTSKFTNVPGELTAYGVVAEAALSAAAVGNVKLSGGAPHSAGPIAQQAAEADLSGTLTGTANGSMVDVAADAGACAGAGSPSATNVDTAIATAVAPIVTGVNEQLKELQTKLNATLAKLRLAGLLEDA